MEEMNLKDPVILRESKDEAEPLLRPIAPTRAERWGVPVSLALGYVYVMSALSDDWRWWLLAFTAMLCGGVLLCGNALLCDGALSVRHGESFLRGGRSRRESWIWLICLWTCLLCGLFGRNRVWGESVWLSIHAFGAYWLIARSDRMLDGASSVCLPADLACGLLVYPFKHFLLRLRVARAALGGRERRGHSPAALLGAVAAAAVALVLFCLAGIFLSEADPNFQRLAGDVRAVFGRFDLGTLSLRLLLSLPVGAYLYGMVFGARREAPEDVLARRGRIDAGVRALRRVPGGVWPVLLGAFSAMYLMFFALQGSYLFDALRSVLPEPFTAAQYARRGFFELCGVMAVNFTLLGAAALSAEGGLRGSSAAKWMATVLLIMSGLFAVTAAAKLYLYIHRFGFTPLRLRSAWLVGALFAGCAAALRHLWTGRDSVRPWLVFTGVALAVLHLY